MQGLNIRASPTRVVGLALLAVLAGSVALVTSSLQADDSGEYPERKVDGAPEFGSTPLPFPDESSARSLSEAREELLALPGMAAVFTNVEAGDVDGLLQLADTGNFCERTFRASEVPDECSDNVELAVYHEGSGPKPLLLPVDSLRRSIGNVFALGTPELTLVTKEQGAERYYLLLKGAGTTPDADVLYDGLGIVVEPGQDLPVRWLRMIIPWNNGIEWMQLRATEAEGEPRFDLVAPESVADWPGMWGETSEGTGQAH